MSFELNTNYLKTINWERDIPNILYPAPDLTDCSICLIWFEFFLIRSRYQTKKKNRLFWPPVVGSGLVIKFSISQKSFCRIAEEPCIKNNQTLPCLKALRMHSSQDSSCYSQLESKIKIHASEITELKYALEGMVQGTDIGLGSVIDWDVINRREWNLPRDRFQICLESFKDFLMEFCTVNLFKNLHFSQNKGHAPGTCNVPHLSPWAWLTQH